MITQSIQSPRGPTINLHEMKRKKETNTEKKKILFKQINYSFICSAPVNNFAFETTFLSVLLGVSRNRVPITCSKTFKISLLQPSPRPPRPPLSSIHPPGNRGQFSRDQIGDNVSIMLDNDEGKRKKKLYKMKHNEEG